MFIVITPTFTCPHYSEIAPNFLLGKIIKHYDLLSILQRI